LTNKDSSETVSDALWMSILAGLGGVFIAVLLLGSFYLFDPVSRRIIDQHSVYFLGSVAVIFVVSFGISILLTLRMQLWRGKWD